MAIQFQPTMGAILVCDYSGFKEPEMVKRRPVIVISPKLKHRQGLCTVVPLSTKRPRMPYLYNYIITLNPPLPSPYDQPVCWVKGDMIATVSWQRLYPLFNGKDSNGKRIYDKRVIEKEELIEIKKCVLCGIGMEQLTTFL